MGVACLRKELTGRITIGGNALKGIAQLQEMCWIPFGQGIQIGQSDG